jgi:hypoxanthine-DNA glycosylase
MTRTIRCFEPIINDRSKILVLGSMPGPKSLEKTEYYANERNQFWKIIYQILGEEPHSHYVERVDFLKRNGIALWDVLQSCEREGACDTKIRKGKLNDFGTLLYGYPNVRCIFFNGKTASEIFDKGTDLTLKKIQYETLPSTSPANTKPLREKLKHWKRIKAFL